MASTPDTVKQGACLAYTGGDYIYALRGYDTTDFWRYSISENSWTSMTSTPAKVGLGGALAYTGGDYIYALRGNNTTDFWRYSISENSWTSMTSTPDTNWYGASLAYTGDYIYALRGGNTTDFWRYTVGGDTGYDKLASQGLLLRGNIIGEGIDFALIDGDLGIGTTTPTAKLTVTQSGTGDIVNLYDNSYKVFQVADGGEITAWRNATLTGGNLTIGPLSPPSNLSVATSSSSGSCATGTTYYYRVTAVNPNGETLGSTEVSITTGDSDTAIDVSFDSVEGATGYKVYRHTSSISNGASVTLVDNTTKTTTSFTDDCSGDGTGTIPLKNTTGGQTQTKDIVLSGGSLSQTIGDLEELVGQIASTTLDGAIDVAVKGKYAYVLARNNQSLVIIDISNPSSPQIVGSVSNSLLSGARRIKISGNYAYVLTTNAKLTIVDISNPSSPQVVSSVNLGTGGTEDLGGLYVSGKYVYTGPVNCYFSVVDVEDPSSPRIIATWYGIQACLPSDMWVSGNYAYMTSPFGWVITVFDISNPASPQKVAVAGTHFDAPSALYLSGKYLYVVSKYDGNEGLEIWDVSNPSSLSLVSYLSHPLLDNCRSIEVKGDYAYISSYDKDRIVVVDVSDPSNPQVVKSFSHSSIDGPKGFDISGRYLYLANFESDTLAIIDISGLKISTAFIGDIFASSLKVSENLRVGNNLYVDTGINVGPSGVYSQGRVSVFETSSVPALTVTQNGAGAIIELKNTSSATSTAFTLTNLGTGNTLLIEDEASDATPFVIDADGNVGIGTTTPSYKLTVSGDLYVSATSTFGSATSTPTILTGYIQSDIIPYSDLTYDLGSSSFRWANLYAGTTTIGSTITIGSHTFEGSATTTLFTTGNSNQLVLGANGNIGIGTAEPTAKLTVIQSGTGEIVDFKSGSTSIFTLTSADRLKLRDGLLTTFGGFNDLLDDFEDGDISNWTSSDSSNTTLATTTSARVNDVALTIQTTVGASNNDTATTSPSATNWSSYERLGFWIKADYTTTSTDATTTQIISIQFHDTGGNTQTHNISIEEMNEWQYEEWDISGISSADKDNVDWLGFRIDNDYGSPKFYIDQIRLYDDDERTSEMFVDSEGNLNIWGKESVEIGRTSANQGSLPSIKAGSAVVELNQPLSVNVGGDVGLDYDLVFLNTGLSTISSEGPLKISAGDSNHYENLTLTTGGTGDIIFDIADSTIGLKVLGSSDGGYVLKISPKGNVEIAQNLTLIGGNINVNQLSTPEAPTLSALNDNGGSCTEGGTYYYRITAINDNGETLGSSEVSITLGGSNSTNDEKVQISWSPVQGATGYKIYRSVDNTWDGANDYLVDGTSVSAGETSYIDDCAGDSLATLPSENTTGGKVDSVDVSEITAMKTSGFYDVSSSGITVIDQFQVTAKRTLIRIDFYSQTAYTDGDSGDSCTIELYDATGGSVVASCSVSSGSNYASCSGLNVSLSPGNTYQVRINIVDADTTTSATPPLDGNVTLHLLQK